MIPFIDGHLDLALNALGLRRQITRPLQEVRDAEAGAPLGPFETATVTLPELRRGGAVMVVSTLLARCRPWRIKPGQLGGAAGDFPDQDMAHAIAQAQWSYYQCLQDRREIRMVLTADDLPPMKSDAPSNDGPLPLLVVFEGADPIRDPDDLHRWHAQGVRSLMLAHFGKSVYAHGTPEVDHPNAHDVDGPLTEQGRRLLPEIESLRMPLDLTHLSDTSLHEALERFGGAVYASHCACRALNPDWQRNLPDEVICAIAQRGGVIGVPLHSPFLVAGYTRETPRQACNLDHIIDHLDHLCAITGSDAHAALGTDMDGGFGLEYTPTGVDGSGEMPRLAERMAQRGWSEASIRRVFGENWHRFYAANLPPRK